ncbi:glycosyltransferase family 4 protein [uncultured Pseudoalteromonas sp.]|uniref:glycosyltransferase family 4 protein n=1 Tax=uncultured Pseudoalteromonas sp. TaxID=114053 RepID=UPI000C5D1D7F|nr:glycosyltransferase family 4 protein [uncultured Pseudoalteromonas sp.]MBD58421.1 glycosyl transferase family 1 [Pseudoalteromonas sp.]|tara:strand:+ start:290 stop:1402 length:1113 start_codon:yes stop_codon:yes gene_type:complete
MSKRVLVNAGNLHHGGGVQVAVSFITELITLETDDIYFLVVVSSQVKKNLTTTNLPNNIEICELNIVGFEKKSPEIFKSDIDLVFTIFGPLYFNVQVKHVVGFANPWIIYPDNEIYKQMSTLDKIKMKFKLHAQSVMFKKADKLIVELEHVKKGLVEKKIAKYNDIHVVHNCASNIYFNKDKWVGINDIILNKRTGSLCVGFLGRDYLHKNTEYLLNVKKHLESLSDKKFEFYVTFSKEEWDKKSDDFKKSINNLGVLKVNQCPNFYKLMDMIIFPSFLECFSATPFEAMLMKTPIFASDRPFIRDACADHVKFIDPKDPKDAALKILGYLNLNQIDRDEMLENAKKYAKSFSDAQGRAAAYISIIKDNL